MSILNLVGKVSEVLLCVSSRLQIRETDALMQVTYSLWRAKTDLRAIGLKCRENCQSPFPLSAPVEASRQNCRLHWLGACWRSKNIMQSFVVIFHEVSIFFVPKALSFIKVSMVENQTDNINWQLFDIGCISIRRCSLCLHKEKFEPLTAQNYYCARLRQWTSVIFECPFWAARKEWKEWYAHCTATRERKRT
jgi:hypothetical protein